MTEGSFKADAATAAKRDAQMEELQLERMADTLNEALGPAIQSPALRRIAVELIDTAQKKLADANITPSSAPTLAVMHCAIAAYEGYLICNLNQSTVSHHRKTVQMLSDYAQMLARRHEVETTARVNASND